jgi:hypothetical protein
LADFFNFLQPVFLILLGKSLGDAMRQMGVQYLDLQISHRRPYGMQLHQNIWAIPALVNHFFDAFNLPGDTIEPW